VDLKEYNSKRNFDKTPEPRGKSAPVSEQRRFVIQRHAARKLHYDLRLEIEGTLKSWAVPRGPSMNPADKRLAIRTEDHPVKYLQFQGTIPKGNYGAGEMIIWDHGTFDLDTAEYPEAAVQLRKGNLKIIFHGRVLKGKFSLVRTGNREEKESWLLIKKEDAYSTAIRYDAEDLLPDHVSDKAAGMKGIEPGKLVLPMLASTSANIFNDPGWYFELKWDGYRAIAHLTDNGVLLQSRHGVSFNKKFTRVTDELGQIAQETILDGEIVIVNDDGVSQFGELQNYPESSGTLLYYVFDML
jgi:bifunctional non-homologous end joining protein LigD